MDGTSNPSNAIKHPDTGKLVVERNEIKKVSVEYCKKVLSKNNPKEEYKKMSNMKDYLHKERMNQLGQGFIAKKETFDKVINKFIKNNKRSYDFLLKSSDDFKH